MEFPIFQVSLKHYSIRNWEEKKKPLLDKIPTGEYTDFMAYQRDLAVPPYLDELSDCVKEEVADVVEEVKDVVEQAKDVADAAKGTKRRGRKPAAKKTTGKGGRVKKPSPTGTPKK